MGSAGTGFSISYDGDDPSSFSIGSGDNSITLKTAPGTSKHTAEAVRDFLGGIAKDNPGILGVLKDAGFDVVGIGPTGGAAYGEPSSTLPAAFAKLSHTAGQPDLVVADNGVSSGGISYSPNLWR